MSVDISVIIPTFNEAPHLAQLLEGLSRESISHEVIIVDAASTDQTLSISHSYHTQVIQSSKGRGIQLKQGALKAKGKIFLFLHADSKFPKGGLSKILESLKNKDVAGGNFRLLFDGESSFSRWLNGFYQRIRMKGFYYGDSAIFIRKDIYFKIGQFKSLWIMEDFDLVRRLEKKFQTVCIQNPPMMTSTRRFNGRKSHHIILGWIKIHLLFFLGFPNKKLALIYERLK